MGGRGLRRWAASAAAVAVLSLPVGCVGVGAAARSSAEVSVSAVTTDSSVPRVVSRVVVTGPGVAAGAGDPATATATRTATAASRQPCTAVSGFSFSLANAAHGAATPAAAVAAFLAGPQYAPGYPAAPGRWHVVTRKVHEVNFSAGVATLSVVDLADKTWVVISGETCAGKAATAPALSATAIGYLDDGVHVMSAPVRRRAAVLLAEWAAWNAQPHPAGLVQVPQYYPDPEQSAVIESASTVGGNLQVSFEGGGGSEHTICGEGYYPTAAQSSAAVVIYLVKVVGPMPAGRNTGCGGVGIKRTVTVTLHGLVSGRQVIDLITGRPMPRT